MLLSWAENLTSGQLFIIYGLVMVGTFFVSIKWPTAPFLAFATQFTIGFIGSLINRYFHNKTDTAFKMAACSQNMNGADRREGL